MQAKLGKELQEYQNSAIMPKGLFRDNDILNTLNPVNHFFLYADSKTAGSLVTTAESHTIGQICMPQSQQITSGWPHKEEHY